MIIPDVNVLIGAYDPNARSHAAAQAGLAQALVSAGGLGLSSVAVSGFVRVNLRPQAGGIPQAPPNLLDYVSRLKAHPDCHDVEPGPAHWPLFDTLVRRHVTGHRQVTDAWFAALAMERGATLMTFDGGFSQFRDLRWIHLKS
ncbi:TA system VapC family ribonuclease toxin [Hyphomonas sp.]|uniref:TA system VapC family ribonuclease toxin n=1 Tax=Hyphomonas sp. TaxID=87 RepID=UPI00391DC56A